jgi:hypothetical protein
MRNSLKRKSEEKRIEMEQCLKRKTAFPEGEPSGQYEKWQTTIFVGTKKDRRATRVTAKVPSMKCFRPVFVQIKL